MPPSHQLTPHPYQPWWAYQYHTSTHHTHTTLIPAHTTPMAWRNLPKLRVIVRTHFRIHLRHSRSMLLSLPFRIQPHIPKGEGNFEHKTWWEITSKYTTCKRAKFSGQPSWEACFVTCGTWDGSRHKGLSRAWIEESVNYKPYTKLATKVCQPSFNLTGRQWQLCRRCSRLALDTRIMNRSMWAFSVAT